MLKKVLFYLLLTFSLVLFESCEFFFLNHHDPIYYSKYELDIPNWIKENWVSDKFVMNQDFVDTFSISEVEKYKYEVGIECEIKLDDLLLSFTIKTYNDYKSDIFEYLGGRGKVDNKRDQILIKEENGIFSFDCNMNSKKIKYTEESTKYYWEDKIRYVKFVKLTDGYNLFLTTQDDVVLGPFHFTKPI